MNRRVLVIEDSRLEFRFVETLFKRFRDDAYDVDWADNYEEGLARLTQGAYDACLLDYRLGARNGLQLIGEARARGCRVPVLFLTGEASSGADGAAAEAGALGYLVKAEITPGALERALRHAIKVGGALDELRERAARDGLTGLINRGEFDRMLAHQLETARKAGWSLALVLADVDRFKEVNDRHGHPAGDAVLRTVASRLSAGTGAAGWAARLGGDEFAVVLAGVPAAEAEAAAARLRALVAAEPAALPGGTLLEISISVGAAAFSGAETAEALVTAADRALYRFKEAGRTGAGGP